MSGVHVPERRSRQPLKGHGATQKIGENRNETALRPTEKQRQICRICMSRKSTRGSELCATCRTEPLCQRDYRYGSTSQEIRYPQRTAIDRLSSSRSHTPPEQSPRSSQVPFQTARFGPTQQSSMNIDPGSLESKFDDVESDSNDTIRDSGQIPLGTGGAIRSPNPTEPNLEAFQISPKTSESSLLWSGPRRRPLVKRTDHREFFRQETEHNTNQAIPPHVKKSTTGEGSMHTKRQIRGDSDPTGVRNGLDAPNDESGTASEIDTSIEKDKNDVIRLRVDANATVSLDLDGSFEGKTIKLVPVENGMMDIIIGRSGDKERDMRRRHPAQPVDLGEKGGESVEPRGSLEEQTLSEIQSGVSPNIKLLDKRARYTHDPTPRSPGTVVVPEKTKTSPAPVAASRFDPLTAQSKRNHHTQDPSSSYSRRSQSRTTTDIPPPFDHMRPVTKYIEPNARLHANEYGQPADNGHHASSSKQPDTNKSGKLNIESSSPGSRGVGIVYYGTEQPLHDLETKSIVTATEGKSKTAQLQENPLAVSNPRDAFTAARGRRILRVPEDVHNTKEISRPTERRLYRKPSSPTQIKPPNFEKGVVDIVVKKRGVLKKDQPCFPQLFTVLDNPILDAAKDVKSASMEDKFDSESQSTIAQKVVELGSAKEFPNILTHGLEPIQLSHYGSVPTGKPEIWDKTSEARPAIPMRRSPTEEKEDKKEYHHQDVSLLPSSYAVSTTSSSYAASIASSVFSKGSLASSATDMSRGGGYSAVQIATATKVLLSVLHEDGILFPLYKSAINNPEIGPERLQRNLGRIFKAYSKLLETEATERLEYLASKLVLIKSAFLANSIVEKLRNDQQNALMSGIEHLNESSDEDDDGNSEEPPLVNEEAFEDLVVFREFLVESKAFQSLRARVQAFVTPKSTRLLDLGSMEENESPKNNVVRPCLADPLGRQKACLTWPNWIDDFKKTIDGLFRDSSPVDTATGFLFLVFDAFMLATDDLLIATGQLEPPLQPGMIRLRWQCGCGDSLYSDVTELRPSGISELIGHMQRTSGAKVHASPYNQRTHNQKYNPRHPVQWIQRAFRKVASVIGRATQPSTSLPQHNTQCPISASATPNNPAPQQRTLHLLACMHRDRLRKVLQQDPIENVTTDRTLVCFLRKQYIRHRGRILHMLSLKSIKGVLFVKFRLPIGGSVDVRHHDPCCVAASVGAMTCECIPPSTKVEPSPGAEYQCIPGPPATYPPIPPEYLSSLITCPTDVHEKDTWILDQLPKRTCGELQGQIGKPAEGWGIYYQEGWDRDAIALVILVVFIIASLLFGILWSRFKYDVQGAFGVSAYMIACCAVLIPVLSTRAEKMG